MAQVALFVATLPASQLPILIIYLFTEKTAGQLKF